MSTKKDPTQASTIRGKDSFLDRMKPCRSLALTIAFHPDTDRIGEVAMPLGERESGQIRASRLEPRFQPAGGGVSRALESAFVSRDELLIDVHKDGRLRISGSRETDFQVDRLNPSAAHALPPAAVERGVVITLGSGV